METKESTDRMDKSSFSVVSLFDMSDEKEYWLSRTPLERLEAVEILRKRMYGTNPVAAGLQRVFSVAQLA